MPPMTTRQSNSRIAKLSAAVSLHGRLTRRSWQLHALMLLPLAYLILFKYVPMYGAQIAFKNFMPAKGILGSDWVGLAHFVKFFHAYPFKRVMTNTIALNAYNLAVGFPLPILLALSLNAVRRRGFKKTVQMATFAPYFISVVVMVGIIMEFLAPRTGIVNDMRAALGMERLNFIAEPGHFWHLYVWSDIWQNIGFGCIIYLAALSSVDPSLHEAATVDGATRLQRIRHIDIPGILPIAVILFILNMGNALEIGFEKVFLMQNTLNISASEVIDTYVYKVGISSSVVNFSYAAAVGLFKSVVGFTLLVTVNRAARKVGQASLW